MSLTVSRVTADGAVIRWAIHNCIGSAPTIYVFYWFPIGKPPSLSTWNSAFVNASSETNQYNITGLSSRTKYYLEFQVHDSCGFINVHTELVDVLMPSEFHPHSALNFLWTRRFWLASLYLGIQIYNEIDVQYI